MKLDRRLCTSMRRSLAAAATTTTAAQARLVGHTASCRCRKWVCANVGTGVCPSRAAVAISMAPRCFMLPRRSPYSASIVVYVNAGCCIVKYSSSRLWRRLPVRIGAWIAIAGLCSGRAVGRRCFAPLAVPSGVTVLAPRILSVLLRQLLNLLGMLSFTGYVVNGGRRYARSRFWASWRPERRPSCWYCPS